ncbi:MAG TPA: histidine kinase [Egibacteraceae bacterium]
MEALRRLARRWLPVLVAGALLLLGVIDVALVAARGPLASAVVIVADVAAALALLVSGSLPRRAALACVGSGAATVVAWLAGGSVPGLAEGAAMLGLLLLCTRWASPALVAALAAVLVLAPTRMFDAAATVTVVLLWALGAAAAIGAGAFLRSLDDERRRAEVAVRDAERQALARDLHDFVAHHVTGIVVQAQAARVVAASDPARVEPLLAGIEQAGAEAMSSMRRLVRVLRDDDPATAPSAGVADLADLARTFSEGGRPVVDLHVDERVARAALPPEVATTIHRIVLESLTNVRRHAPQATRVRVAVAGRPDGVAVTVTDDGPAQAALDGRSAGGFGLLGLRERVAAVGGDFRAGPLPQGGWQVAALLPLDGRLPPDGGRA